MFWTDNMCIPLHAQNPKDAMTLKELQPVIGLPPSVTANAPTVFPSQRYTQLSRNYYQFKNQEELSAWNNLFLPITQGS